MALSTSVLARLVIDYSNDSEKYEDTLKNFLSTEVMQNVQVLVESDVIVQKQCASSLSKLLALSEASSMAWTVFSVIEALCSTTSTNIKFLKHCQNILLPHVAKLLVHAASEERKLRLLKVLQALTYGIVIQVPDEFTPRLFKILSEWSKDRHNSKIVNLSLTVLVNILYGNRSCMYILMKAVNVKELMTHVLCLQKDIVCRQEASKFIFLLEDLICEKQGRDEILDFIRISFTTIVDSCSSREISVLQHCVQYFNGMVLKKRINREHFCEPWCHDSVGRVLQNLENMDSVEIGMLLFKFIGLLVEMNIPSMFEHYEKILRLGVKWVQEHPLVASEAINTMHIILSQLSSKMKPVSGIDAKDLKMVFLPLLNGAANCDSQYEFQTSLLKFFKCVLDVEGLNISLKENLKPEMVESFLQPLKNINPSDYESSTSCIKMFVHLAEFLSKITVCVGGSWMKMSANLFRDQRLLFILASALLNGECDLKSKVLSVICTVGFPGESIGILAKGMHSCASGTLSVPDSSHEFIVHPGMLRTSNIQKLKEIVDNLHIMREQNKLQETSVVQVLQLYQYKDQLSQDYEESLFLSLNKASEQNSLLRNHLSTSNEIISKLREELCCTQPALDELRDKYDDALKEISSLKQKLNSEISSCKETVFSMKSTIQEQQKLNDILSKNIKNLKAELVEANKSCLTHVDENNRLQTEIEELQKASSLLSEQIMDKDNRLEKLTSENLLLKEEKQQLESQCQTTNKRITEFEQEISGKNREILELKQIKDTIFELTGGMKKF